MPGESHETTETRDQRSETRDQRPETRDQDKQQMSRQKQITLRSTTRQQQNAYFNYLPGYITRDNRNQRPVIRDQRPETRDTDQGKQQIVRQQQITQRSTTRQQQKAY